MFNKTKILVLGLIVSTLTLRAQDSLSLDDCIFYALENHLGVKNSELDEEKALKQINETRAVGLPQIDGKIDLMANVEVQKQFVPDGPPFGNPMGDPNETVSFGLAVPYSSNANLTVNQLLFSSSFLVGLEAAKTYEKLSAQNTQLTKEDITLNVTKAYYGVLVNEHRAELLNANKSQLEKLLSDAEALYEAGMMEAIELSKLSVSLNNLITEIEKVEALNEISENLLKFNMGKPLTEKVLLSESLEELLASSDTAKVVQLNPESRIDYQLLQTQYELSELNIKNYKSNGIPTAVAFGSFGANYGVIQLGDLPQFNNWEPYALVGLQVNIPIFSSFRNKSLVQQAEIDKEKIVNQMQQATDGFELEYLQLKRNFENYLGSLARQRKNLDLAQKVYDDAQIKFTAGVGTNYDIVAAQTSLKEAQINYLATVYDLLITQVELDKCTGNLKR